MHKKSTSNPMVLGIDCSAATLGLCLLSDRGFTARRLELARGHAEIIFSEIGALLDGAGADYADLIRIAVISGPGSFTGVRIGLSAARGLGFGLAIPVVGIPKLLALSLGPDRDAPCRIVLDAHRGEAYVAEFSAPGVEMGDAALRPSAEKGDGLGDGMPLIEDPELDMEQFVLFARDVTPEDFPPEPFYLRSADAKPQDRFRVARQ